MHWMFQILWQKYTKGNTNHLHIQFHIYFTHNGLADSSTGITDTVNGTEDAVIEVYTDSDKQMPQPAATTSSTQDIPAVDIGENNELIYHQM